MGRSNPWRFAKQINVGSPGIMPKTQRRIEYDLYVLWMRS
jgi:hypothetical protein